MAEKNFHGTKFYVLRKYVLMKSMKILPNEIFPLYGIRIKEWRMKNRYGNELQERVGMGMGRGFRCTSVHTEL